MKRFLPYAVGLAICVTPPATAQDEEESDAGGPLVRFLENTLSNDDRTIQVIGLDGALSARATIEKLIISDDEGPWLTLEGAVLDWNRLALVRGRFSVNELTAEKLLIPRRPNPPANPPTDLPSPEAKPFQIPELPVAIEIGQLGIGEVDLGEPVVGTAATLAVNGRLNLAGGALDTVLSVSRLDRAGDALTLQAGYANETRNIDLDVTLTEAAGGLLSTVLNMPGAPAVAFTARGNGPVEDFTADIGLATDGIRRFGGTVALSGEAAADGEEGEAIAFQADLGGDVTALMDQAFHPFFGDNTQLSLDGARQPSGELAIDTLSISAQALDLQGSVSLTATGAPEKVRLDGRLAAHDGSDRLILPVAGADTSIRAAEIGVSLDATERDDWTLAVSVDGFENPAASVDRVSLTGDGVITLGDATAMSGAIAAMVAGLNFPDDTLTTTVGDEITLDGRFDLPGDGTLALSDFQLDGAGLEATAGAEISGLGSGFQLNGEAEVSVDDLSRFAALTGQDLSGTLAANLTGNGAPLGGNFDVVLKGTAQDVTVGIPQADGMLAGTTSLNVDVERGPDGIELRGFDVSNPQLSANGTGALKTDGTTLDFNASVTEFGILVPQFPGQATLTAELENDDVTWSGKTRFDGPEGLFADVEGDVTTTGGADVTISAALPHVDRFVPQLVGQATIDGTVERSARTGEGRAVLDIKGPDDLFADLDATIDRDNQAVLSLDAALTKLEAFVPQLVGAATVKINATGDVEARTADGTILINGPQDITAEVDGTLDAEGKADVKLTAALGQLETFVPQLVGPATVTGDVTADINAQTFAGKINVDGPEDLVADIDGTLDEAGQADVTLTASLGKLETFVPQLVGPAKVSGDVSANINTQAASGKIRVDGPDDLYADIDGSYDPTGPVDLDVLAELPKLEAFVAQLPGPAKVKATVTRADGAADWIADMRVNAPQDIIAALDGSLKPDGTADVDLSAEIPQLETFVPQLVGRATLDARADRPAASTDWTADVRLRAPEDITADVTGTANEAGSFDMQFLAELQKLEAFVAQLPGLARLTGEISRSLDGEWKGLSRVTAPSGIAANLDGSMTEGGPLAANVDATVPNLGPFVPQLPGPATLKADVSRDTNGEDWSGQIRMTGPKAIALNADGTYSTTGPTDVAYSAEFPEIERFVAQLVGTLKANGKLTHAGGDAPWLGSTQLSGPQNISVKADGEFDPDGAVNARIDAGLGQLETFVPQIPGAVALKGEATRDASGQDWKGSARLDGPDNIFADLQGTLSQGGAADVTFDAELTRMERFVPDFPGSVKATGSAKRASGIWTIDTNADLPSGATVAAAGTYDETQGTADINAKGGVQLGAANTFITPMSVLGAANFDLTLKGPPALESLSGQITTSGVSVAIPQIQNAINDFGGSINLTGGQAAIDLRGQMRTGGGFTIGGPVTLSPPFNGTIDVALQELILTDNIVYETVLGGGVRLSGPLTGAATVSGQVNVGETEINIATAGGAPGSAAIPEMQHIGETQAEFLTRKHAGLVVEDKEDEDGGGGPSSPIRLDVTISAPQKIFVRGRGLESELGGEIYVGGTVSNIQPAGQIELLRGSLNIFTKPLELTKGVVTLQGNLEPTLDFEATTTTSEGTATLSIDGPATAPEITVTSDPERPTEEALAMLVFGDQFTNLSPIKVAQLAASLRRLQGGGGGLTNAAREGLGVDSLNLTTDAEGNAAVGVGTYISDNIYTDVTVNAKGDSEVNINFDVSRSVTLKGSVDNESNTSLGIFFERDY